VTRQPVQVGLGDSIYREFNLRGLWMVNWLNNAPPEEVEQTYRELADLAAKGVVSSEVEATYQVADFRQALEHARRPGRTGKVLFQK
jgi:NADPH:quinone reductase-like Zn-dependent oxidoreductase